MPPTTKETIAILLVLLLSGILITSAFIYQTTPTSIISINLTIVEKYPTHSYQRMCGGGKAAGATCTYTDPATIVDDKGDLYIVENENDWAKMRINKTYNVQYASYPNAQKGKIVGINYIVGDS